MYSPIKIINALCLLFLIYTGPGAAVENPVWQTARITSEQGLSNSAVNTVFRDSRGYMWFGSWDGLNRFDGKNIRSYYPDLFDTRAVSNNIIRRLLEDEQGDLWIVTERGINRYSHDMENFSSWFTAYPELALQEESLKAVQGLDGNIWVNAHGLGLFRFSPDDDDFLQVSMDGLSDDDSKRITCFYCDPEGLYLLLEDSLIVLNSTSGRRLTTIFIPDLPGGINFSATTGSWFFNYNDEVILARGLRDGGLQIIYPGSQKVFLLKQGDQGFRITSLNMSADKDFIWLGTDDGNVFQLYPTGNFNVRPVLHHLPELVGKRVKIWSILETPDDLLWIGTDGEGVFRSMLKPKPFFRIGRGEPGKRQLNHHIVRAIYEDRDGGLWVGTRGNGLNHIPFQHGETRYFNTSNGLTNDAVLSLRKDHDEYLWIGHDGMGIDIMDMRTGTFYHFPEDLEGAEDLEFGSVYAICVDAFGQVWLGTSGYGVLGLNIRKEGGKFTLIDFMHIRSENSGDPLQSNIVYSIVEEKPNVLWLGTRGAGIYRLNTLTGQMENFMSAAPGKPGISDNDVLSLHVDSNNFLWVGSSRGLTRVNINYTPFAFNSYTISNGLPSNTIHAILEDGDGDIWVSTNKGLGKLITAEDRFLNFNIADGLQGNEYSDGAACHGQRTGKFYFGGVNGLSWFYPENIISSGSVPVILFTGLKVHNDEILPGDSTGILYRNLNDLNEISLKHNQNFFTMGFTTLNFINPDKNLLGYKLENFHSDWVFLGNQREASFTNVPPGKYTLKVRATTEEGLWPDEARELQVIILPPFRQTFPAYLIYIIMFSALIFAILRYHSRRVRRRQQRALEKMQQDREKELNQYKLQFFTNLAHEFGTPLTLIFASAASLLKPEKEPGETRALTQTIYQNSRRMQTIVQELLEFRKIETGREKLSLKLVELVDILNNITETFSHFARENEVELSFEPEEEELFCLLDPMKLDKIMLNLISNAIKNTPEGGSVTLSLEHSGQDIIIRVADTGSGISAEVLPYIFDGYSQQTPGIKMNTRTFKGIGIGLAYTRSLVELHGGNITVRSHPGKGSTFKVTLPLKIPDTPGNSRSPIGDVTARKNLIESVAEEFLNHNRHARSVDNSRTALWTMPGKYKILVAEDDPELSDLLYKMLSEQYDVYPVHDGLQALEIIRNKRIDVVISDVMMPGMDGLALCSAIKDDMLTSHIQVILLTVRSEIENLIEGLEMGADSYIPKPFHPRHLLVKIEKLLRSREQASDYFKKNFGTPAYNPEQKYSPRDKELLEKCITFIEANYMNESLDAGMMASHLAMSKAQLYRKIKALTGLTPHLLIRNYRLKKARHMIKEDKYSISEIIHMTGFNNRTYFYRSFKGTYGETPGEMNRAGGSKRPFPSPGYQD